MHKWESTVVVLFLLMVTMSTVVFAGDAAMVIDLRNGRAFYASGERTGEEVLLLDFLKEGDRIKVESTTTIVLTYFTSGMREEINGPGKLTVGSTESKKEDESVAIKREKVEYLPPRAVLETGDLQQTGTVVLRGGSGLEKIKILSLANTVIRSSEAVFCWHPVERVDTYKLRVYDVLDRLCLETTTNETKFTYNNSNLQQGERYWWNVLALGKGEIIAKGEGQFSILTQENVEKLNQAERGIRDRSPQESDELLVSLALLYQNYGLYDEAREIFEGLRRKYPQNKNVIRYLQKLCLVSE